MKRILISVLLVIVGIALGLSAALAVYYFTGDDLYAGVLGTSRPAATASIAADSANDALTGLAYKILGYLKAGDYKSLSQTVHPDYGVVFSPYATISLASDKSFTAAQVAAFAGDKNNYVWGKYDGSGQPISMTPQEYLKKFVFDKDYTMASVIGVDTVVKSGNSLENIKDVFPKVRFVDFHIPGTDADSGGLDWSSLRLGFEEYKGELKLTVVVHSQWTV